MITRMNGIPEEENLGRILHKFIEMLKRNDIAYSELTQSDTEIERYPTISKDGTQRY